MHKNLANLTVDSVCARQHVTDAFEYLGSSLTTLRLPCTTRIVSIGAVPGYTLHSQVRQFNNQSTALTAEEAAPIPALTPAPLPAQYPVTSVAAGLALSENATLELCVPHSALYPFGLASGEGRIGISAAGWWLDTSLWRRRLATLSVPHAPFRVRVQRT